MDNWQLYEKLIATLETDAGVWLGNVESIDYPALLLAVYRSEPEKVATLIQLLIEALDSPA